MVVLIRMVVVALALFVTSSHAIVTSNTVIPTTLSVCVYHNEPYVSCNDTTKQVLGGFSVQVWQAIATNLNFQTVFTCHAHAVNAEDDMNAGLCDIALGMTATDQRLVQYGWDFSTPTIKTGWGILARRSVQADTTIRLDSSAFKFFATFDYTLWVAIIVTMVGTAMMIALIEGCNANSEEFPRDWARGLWEGTWCAASTMLTLGTDKPIQTVPCRIIQLLWQFMMLIVVSSYTANLASLLTVSAAQSSLSGPQDLAGQVVECDNFYSAGLTALGAVVVARDVETESDLLAMIADLKNHVCRAVVGDVVQFQFYAKDDCTLYVLPGDWNIEYNGFAYPQNTSALFRSTISDQILQLQESGTMDTIQAATVAGSDDPCSTTDPSTQTFSWFDLRGLWFIYCFGVAACVVCVAALAFAKQLGIADTLTYLSPQGLPQPEAGEDDKVLYDINHPSSSMDQTPKLLYSVLVELRELRTTVEKQQAQLNYLTQTAQQSRQGILGAIGAVAPPTPSIYDGGSVSGYESRSTLPPHAKLP